MPKKENNSITVDSDKVFAGDRMEGEIDFTAIEDNTKVIISRGDIAIETSPSILSIYAANKVVNRISPVINKTFSYLLRNREFLGHQLSHKIGNLTDEAFEKIIQEYLPPTIKYNLDELKDEIKLLMDVSALVFDAEQLSVMFNCEIDDAEQILTAMVRR
jgi:hypothetical protein